LVGILLQAGELVLGGIMSGTTDGIMVMVLGGLIIIIFMILFGVITTGAHLLIILITRGDLIHGVTPLGVIIRGVDFMDTIIGSAGIGHIIM
jgi:hypothetical protein